MINGEISCKSTHVSLCLNPPGCVSISPLMAGSGRGEGGSAGAGQEGPGVFLLSGRGEGRRRPLFSNLNVAGLGCVTLATGVNGFL